MKQSMFERQSRGFTTGLKYRSSDLIFSKMDEKPDYVTVDSIRGCRGENINIVISPGNTSYFEYQLSAPNDVMLAKDAFSNWRGDQLIGKNVTLPQSGYYVLKTRTQAPGKTVRTETKQGFQYNTTYPRDFAVGFKTDAGSAALQIGDKIDATASSAQPFIKRVSVKGGSKVRFRFASMGTGNFIATVLRATGEQLHQSKTPVAFDEVLAVTPGSDEVFTVRAEPPVNGAAVGMQFSVLDDKVSGTTIAIGDRLQSVFKLPAQYDYERNPAHKTVYATEMARLQYRATAPERIGLVIRPSGASGLTMRVRVYDEATEDVIVDEVITKPGMLPVTISRAGTWLVALGPLSASEMIQAGEAKYTVEVVPSTALPAVPQAATPAGRVQPSPVKKRPPSP